MKKTKVGIVGMGLIGKAHLDALRRVPQVEVVAISERDEKLSREMAERFAIPQWYVDWHEMLSQVDAVHNCTPNALHDPVNLAAIALGKHIYAEKPLSDTAEDAKTVWQSAEKAGVIHGLNHQYRMNAAVQEMRLKVSQGEMGPTFLISGRYHQQSGLYDTDYGWRMTEGGMSCALSDIGTHWVDTACCVLGSRIERVFADIKTIHPVRTKPDGERIEVHTDDLSTVLVTFQNGAQGVLTVSKVSAGHMNDLALGVDGQNFSMYWEQENPNKLRLGYKHAPNLDMTVTPGLVYPEIRDLVPIPAGHPLGWNDALTLAVREFYGVIRGEIAQSSMRIATFEDGFEGVAFVEAAIKSNKSGQWVHVYR